MDKYLIEILKEFNTIIIPDFGALTIVNQATGEVMFMSFMKFDDGKLIKHIAEKENWDENEAKNLVAKYVRDINTKLDQGDTYDMYQFGSFHKNKDGEIDFTPTQSENYSETQSKNSEPIEVKQDSVVEIVEIEEIKSNEIHVEASEIKLEVTEEVIIPTLTEENIVEEEEILAEEEQKLNSSEEIEPIIVSTIETPIENTDQVIVLSIEEQLNDDLDLPPVNEPKVLKKKPILEKTKKDNIKKKKGIGFYILLMLIALFLGGGAFFALNYDRYKNYIPFLASNSDDKKEIAVEKSENENPAPTENNDVEESDPSNSEMDNNEPARDEQDSKETDETPVKPSPSNGSFNIDKSKSIQIIAGSFTEISNANGMVEKLTAQGINAEIVALIDGLNLVSIASFGTKDEMDSNISKIDEMGLKFWVYKK